MLQVQKLLLNGISKLELLENHGVHIKDPINGKVILNYDQLKAKDDDPVAQECRGLILDEKTFEIVAFPFKRFFNYGQGAAANIDWDTAQIQDKLDGSMIVSYWDKNQNQWCASTRAMAEAQGAGNFGYSFRELVERTCIDMGFSSLQHLMAPAPKHYTLIFELTAPENRVVCEYSHRKMSLIGARNLDTLNEVEPDELAAELKVDRPKTWDFNSFETLIEAVKVWDPKEFEGVVVKDENFSRIKVKCPKYLVVHHSIDSLGSSWRSVVAAVAQGHTDDLDGLLPPFVQSRVDIAKEKLNYIKTEIIKDWVELQSIENQKEFALEAQKRKCPSGLFSLRSKKIESIDEFFKNANPDHLVRICDLDG